MKISVVVGALLLAASPLVSHALEDTETFTFPVRVEKNLPLNGGNYEIRLHDLPGKGITGFAWSVMRNGYLLKIEVIDGIGPTLASIPNMHMNGFGILYKAGANQSVLDLVILSNGIFDNVRPGQISSNLSCIYAGDTDKLLSVSEHEGQLTIDQFQINEGTLKTLPTIRASKSQKADVLRECAAKSFFGKELR